MPEGPDQRKRQQPNQEPGDQGPGGPKSPGLKPNRGMFGFVLILSLGMLLFLLISSVGESGRQLGTWAEFINLYNSNQLDGSPVIVRDAAIYAKAKPGPVKGQEGTVYFRIGAGTRPFWLEEVNKLTKGKFVEQPSSFWTNLFVMLIPFLIVLALLWFLFFRGLRNAAGGAGGMLGNFGKSRHKVLMKEKTGVKFADVAGIDEAKDEVGEIIEFLRNPKRFTRLGGRIPRGVLLVGEPGCGKTLLAKAIAGEADVPFFSISGSDFVEMFVGVGASRVRDLFKQAKEAAPCIIFLDEIDAVGRRRGGGFSSGGHDEREQTLNAILVEMDGFTPSDGVIVIAATNRNDVLDPALVRPGRFDRQITVPLPDVKGRVEILSVHAKNKRLGPDVDIERLARATPMFSGADLAAIMNEAAISATLQNKDFIEMEDLEEARDKVKFGRSRKSRVREADENKLTAFHEAGHAVLRALLPDGDPLHKVTIIPRGAAGGATFSLPERDRMGYNLKWLKSTLRVTCGGRIAEQRAMGDISTGASMDIQQVTSLARMMIEQWGMSDKLGFIRYAGTDTREAYLADKAYSEDTAKLIDEEVRRIVDEAYADAERMINEHWDQVNAVAEALIKYESLNADEVMRIMRGEVLTKPTVGDLLAAEARKASLRLPSAPAGDAAIPPPQGAMPSPA